MESDSLGSQLVGSLREGIPNRWTVIWLALSVAGTLALNEVLPTIIPFQTMVIGFSWTLIAAALLVRFAPIPISEGE